MNGNSQESQNNISLCQKINSRALQTPRPNRFLLKQRLRTPASVRESSNIRWIMMSDSKTACLPVCRMMCRLWLLLLTYLSVVFSSISGLLNGSWANNTGQTRRCDVRLICYSPTDSLPSSRSLCLCRWSRRHRGSRRRHLQESDHDHLSNHCFMVGNGDRARDKRSLRGGYIVIHLYIDLSLWKNGAFEGRPRSE